MKTYWISEDQSTGWTIQNINVDLPVEINVQDPATEEWGLFQEQVSGISNIACSPVVLDSGKLRRPKSRENKYSFIVNYPGSVADASVTAALPALGSLQRTVAYLVANQVHAMRDQFELAGTLYLMSTDTDGTTEVEETWTA